MRIAIDGYNLAMPNGTGVATYGLMLARTLKELGHSVEGVFGLDVGIAEQAREILFYDGLAREADRRRSKPLRTALKGAFDLLLGAKAVNVPITSLVTKEAFADRLPSFDRLYSGARLFDRAQKCLELYGRMITLHVANPPSIMHWTYPVPVRLHGSKNIYTIHDIVPLKLPYTTLDVKKNYYKLIELCLKNADHICTVSEASRSDIIERFGVAEGGITNTYQASPVPDEVKDSTPEDDASMIEGIFGLGHRKYFLFFGAIEPKKNVGRMIEAYLSANVDTPLVIVGARAWQSEAELRLVKGYGRATGKIIQLEYLPRALLMRLARGAKSVFFPSLYEGFGLPVLESLQLGTPVLSSETSSLPEVAGKAAFLVDPYSVSSLTVAIQRVDHDDALRERLATAGIKQAARFSLDAYKERLAAMYAVIDNGSGRA